MVEVVFCETIKKKILELEIYKKYPAGADGDFIEERIYNKKKQLISKVCYTRTYIQFVL